ncbi:hypothetical protein COL32_20505 [Bacillus pseudomycoides]|nr:hypothetical protein CON70_04550 [Bacillus pseudomycoides]PFW91355.1 hypothetical protein COL29_18830 [Bacillus pseudomycoides]PFX40464.1 hypothetical protein COL32_20505 [Bacillus pseudomycoides]
MLFVFSGSSIGSGFGGNGVKNKRGVATGVGDGAVPGKGTEIEPGTKQEIAELLQFLLLFRLKNNHTPLLINCT